jgi:hypothetical protein
MKTKEEIALFYERKKSIEDYVASKKETATKPTANVPKKKQTVDDWI